MPSALDADRAIEIGRLCGVLHQSLTEGATRLRFDTHRAQELFAAWRIRNELPDFDWTGRLDLPRWQETLVNVVQLGGGDTALDMVLETLATAPDRLEGMQSGFNKTIAEAEAAERVELAQRIARELPPSPARDGLRGEIRSALRRFLTEGHAGTKVKMLRVVQQDPTLASFDMLQGALSDPAAWVRDQAHVVATTLAGQVAAAPLAEEIAYGFATGRLITRLPAYLKIALRTRTRTLIPLCLLGAFLIVFQTALFAATGPALVSWLDRLRSAEFSDPILGSEKIRLALDCVATAGGAFFIVWRTPLAWATLMGGGVVIIVLEIVLYRLWINPRILTVEILLFAAGPIYLAVMAAVATLAAIAAAVMLPLAALFGGALTHWAGDHRYVGICVRAVWTESYLEELWDDFKGGLGSWLLILLAGLLLAFAFAIFGMLAEAGKSLWIQFPLMPPWRTRRSR